MDTPTAWQRRDKKGHYSIGSLYFKFINRAEKLSDYNKQALKLGIKSVDYMDQKEVVDYLSGETSECQQIDAALRAQLLIRKSDLRTGKIATAEAV